MTLVRGGAVRPHVQRFADAVVAQLGPISIGTYPGHSPSIDLALDLFTPVNSSTLGNAISGFAIAHQERFGVRYVIYRQRIWHRLDPVWRPMADRGSVTANHFDHVHISFEAAAPEPEPTTPTPEVPEVSKIAYPLEVSSGEARRIPVVAIGGGFGWTRAAITFASTGVEVRRAVVGPNERPIEHLSPAGVASTKRFDGRWYVDLRPGDEWVEIHLDPTPIGALDLYVEAADA